MVHISSNSFLLWFVGTGNLGVGWGGGVAKHVADSRFVGKSGNAVPSQKTAVICLG